MMAIGLIPGESAGAALVGDSGNVLECGPIPVVSSVGLATIDPPAFRDMLRRWLAAHNAQEDIVVSAMYIGGADPFDAGKAWAVAEMLSDRLFLVDHDMQWKLVQSTDVRRRGVSQARAIAVARFIGKSI